MDFQMKITEAEANKLSDKAWCHYFLESQIEGTGERFNDTLGVLERKLAAVRDATLIEAAKAKCVACSYDLKVYQVTFPGRDDHHYYSHRDFSGALACSASEIHKLRS